MPKAELDCLLFNLDSGYTRKNCSWVLSRLIRDLGYWRPRESQLATRHRLAELRFANENARARLEARMSRAESPAERERAGAELRRLPRSDDAIVASGLRVTVLQCAHASPAGVGDGIYWVGMLVTTIQLGLAAVPWVCYGEWFTFLVTSAGTGLAYASGMLPQWRAEKSWPRVLRQPKRVVLTEGNGAVEALLLLCEPGDPDFEAMAARPRMRVAQHTWGTRAVSLLLALLWILLALTVAGWEQRTWYLLAVGLVGMLHNVCVAGWPRDPAAYGLGFRHVRTVAERKVMESLYVLETEHPGAGIALLPEFFPGELRPREEKIWEFAHRRREEWVRKGRPVDAQRSCAVEVEVMPGLYRPEGREDDDDIRKIEIEIE